MFSQSKEIIDMPDFGIMRGFNENLFGDKLVAGQLPTQLGLIGSESAFVGLLDLYPNAAAAYSVRKLRTAYTGNAIRVRRSSDNAESDIGFSGANLDESALTSFCSGTNGFVTTWYDQSGNANNAINTTAANQPQIVSSGSVITQNSQPILKFSILNQLNLLTNINRSGLDSSFFMTYKKSVVGNNVVLLSGGSSYLWLNYSSTQYYGNTTVTDADFDTTNYMIAGATMDYGVKLNWYKNNILEQTKTSGFQPNQEVNSIFDFIAQRIESFSNEIIIYSSDQELNATGIITNINSYYAIY
jgi:hypothetical protein